MRWIGIRIGRIAGVNIDQFDHPVGIRARCRHVQGRFQRTGECDVLLQRLRLVHQHIRSTGGETLIVHGVGTRIACRELQRIRNRLARVAHILIESVGALAWRFKSERTPRAEKQRAWRGLFWRPGIEMPPLMCASLEYMRLIWNKVRVTLQESPKERQLNFLAVVFGGFRVEVDVAQFLAIAAAPAAV